MRLGFTVLLFLPSVTFGILSAEIFPWALLVSLLYVRRIDIALIIILSILCASSFYVLFISSFDNSLSTDVIRSLATYANIILITQYILSLSRENIFKLIQVSKYFFYFLILLGFLQNLGSEILDSILKFFIPRGSGTALLESDRGVTLLSTEPARAGIELTLIYLIFRLTELAKHRFHPYDFLLLLYHLFLIKSASSVFFFLIFLGILFFNWRGLFMVPLTMILGFTFIDFSEGGRAINLIFDLIQMDSYSNILFFLVNESGNRLLAIYSFFKYGLSHPFGAGVGLWPISSMQAVLESGFDFTQLRYFDVVSNGQLSPFRGPGVVSNLLLDIGIVGTFFVAYAFFRLIKQCKSANFISKIAIITFVLKILFFGSPGNPIPFIALFAVLRWSFYEDRK